MNQYFKTCFSGQLKSGDDVSIATILFTKNLDYRYRGVFEMKDKSKPSQEMYFLDTVTDKVASLFVRLDQATDKKSDDDKQLIPYKISYHYTDFNGNDNIIANITGDYYVVIGGEMVHYAPEVEWKMDKLEFNSLNQIIYLGDTLNEDASLAPERNWLTSWIGKDLIYGVKSDIQMLEMFQTEAVYDYILFHLLNRNFSHESNKLHIPIWIIILTFIAVCVMTAGLGAFAVYGDGVAVAEAAEAAIELDNLDGAASIGADIDSVGFPEEEAISDSLETVEGDWEDFSDFSDSAIDAAIPRTSEYYSPVADIFPEQVTDIFTDSMLDFRWFDVWDRLRAFDDMAGLVIL